MLILGHLNSGKTSKNTSNSLPGSSGGRRWGGGGGGGGGCVVRTQDEGGGAVGPERWTAVCVWGGGRR